MTKPFAIIIDLESTGTDVKVDALLEIGAIAVDEELNNLSEFSQVVHTTRTQLLQGTWPDFWKMHGLNGLITEASDPYSNLPSLASVDESFVQWLLAFGFVGQDVVLAGNSIGQFDIPMIRAQMPLTASMLHHRAIDISAQARELVRVVEFVRTERNLPHRALADCKGELEEWRDQGVFLRDMRDAASGKLVPGKKAWGFGIQKY